MITLMPPLNDSTMVMKVSGKATEEDAQRLEFLTKEKYGTDQPFNVVAIVEDIDGSTFRGMAKGLKYDMKHMKQMKKVAIVSDKNWLQAMTDIGNYMPGMEMKHFTMAELEHAKAWAQN